MQLGNEQTFEIIELLQPIAKAETKEKADNLYRQAINNISQVIKDAETMQKAINGATTIFNAVCVAKNWIS